MSERIGRFMVAENVASDSAGRSVWEIFSVRGKDLLGEISWLKEWRKFVFIPESGAEFDSVCLGDIKAFLEGR